MTLKGICFLLLLVFLWPTVFADDAQENLRPIEKMRQRRQERLERRGDLVTREQYEGVLSGLDFTKPFARNEFRYQYRQVTGDSKMSFFVFRYDMPYRFENDWIFSPSFEIPLLCTDVVSRDNPGGDSTFGFGDFSTRFLLVSPPKGRWSFAGGAQMFWPTASKDQMGFGKYLLAPTIGAVYQPQSWKPGSFFGVLVANIFDYAGKDDRRDIHELSIQPIVNINLKDAWFVTAGSDTRVNWERDNDIFLPLSVSVGKVIDMDKIISVGFGAPIVNDYDLYDWQIEFRIAYFY